MSKTILDFNAYISTCVEKQGDIHKITREHARKYIEWRTFRRVSGKESILNIANFSRASTLHQNDIQSASLEFEEEIKQFNKWLRDKGDGFIPRSQKMGFENEEKYEWEEIARWWKENVTPKNEVVHFFDNYVHDSRASFKLNGADNEKDLRRDLSMWLKKKRLAESYGAAGGMMSSPVRDDLDPIRRKAAEDFSKNGKIPRMINSGREPMGYPVFAGYLRFRKIYGGFDEVLLGSLADKLDGERALA